MAAEFSVEAVKKCLLERGGRIKNHELVNYFRSYLNDPVHKVANRDKFKDFVNELASIKVEEGEKILVLKRKHRPDSSLNTSSSSSSLMSYHSSASVGDHSLQQTPSSNAPDQLPSTEKEPVPGDVVRARSEPPASGDAYTEQRDSADGALLSKVHSDESLDVKLKASSRTNMSSGGQKQPLAASTASLASAGSQGSTSSITDGVSGSGEDEGNVSVLSIKERVQHLNKISSESDLHQSRGPAPRKKIAKDRDDDDESHTSGGMTYITLTPEEKEWMLVSSTADYHEMFRLLNKNGRLARVKDISNTALHWAAKFGKAEVVKMLANKINVNVNQRSGFTPLHLAAIHGHEDIIELLIGTYKADANIRDFSGKKPKQYLKNSASSRAQHLLVSRKHGSDLVISHDDIFTRAVSARQSNRARALSSLIQGTSAVMRQQALRMSWGSDDGDRTPGNTPPGSGGSSPASARKYKNDRYLMPPPNMPSQQRRRRTERSSSSSQERRNSQSRSTSAIDKENSTHSVPRSESDPALMRNS